MIIQVWAAGKCKSSLQLQGKTTTGYQRPKSQSYNCGAHEGATCKHACHGGGWKKKELHTSTVRNTVALIPSAISYSPFSLGLVKLYSLPGPNILKDTSNRITSSNRTLRGSFSPLSYTWPYSCSIIEKHSTRTGHLTDEYIPQETPPGKRKRRKHLSVAAGTV